jgi:hypothetical protein
MTPAVVLAILVTSGEAASPATAAMASAAAEVVGAEDSVRVVEVSVLSDGEALRVEQGLATRVVVELAWSDAQHLRARLRLHAARTDRWIDRDFVFVAADTPSERGRALGFAMASMIPEGDPSIPIATRAEPPRDQAPEAPPPGPNAIDAAFEAGTGLGGPAGGLGGRLAFERFVADRASLGLSLAARLGHITNLDARVLTSCLGVGGALWAVAPTGTNRLGLAIRGEALVLYERVAHVDASGTTTWKDYALPGGALRLEGTVRLAGALELMMAGGAEIAFGTVDVTVVAAPPAGGTASLPATRAIAEVGLRARF